MERRKTVETLRVLASTTETILPTLRGSRMHMKTCKVMVHDFSTYQDAEMQAVAAKAEGVITTWMGLPRSGAAETVTLKRVKFTPAYFAVNFDDRMLIFGLYAPTSRGRIKFTT
jgi:hypothetical protein